ncbi:uncharacterized protein LOC107039158 [Diachasma alloeum]|uniref:uncharacterized protein LOC107039158 n=1 Tax=Diachasma alloeum TaxID=454923 RepID=UPI000738377A|nr:uncharacterized protein LOC107039158 [Diachasma alloeum]
MKIIGFLFINFVAYALAAQEIDVKASITKVERNTNKWLLIITSSEQTIEFTKVLKPIDVEDDLLIEYKITDKSDQVLGEGSGPLCTLPKSKDGIMVHLMGKFLGVNLECPVDKKEGDKPSAVTFGQIVLDENPGAGTKLFIEISIKKEDTAIVTLNLDGGPQQ